MPTYSRFHHIVSTAIVLLFFLNVVYPQGLSSTTAVAFPTDSLVVHIDTTRAHADSVVAVQPDSTIRRILPTRIGTLDEEVDSINFLLSKEINWIEQTSTGDILSTLPGVYVRDQQSPGAYSGVTIRGEDWRSVAFLMNGRLMNEPASGLYNPFYFSLEYIERI
ncbi:MAG TPA: TonB-dependent receptor plug domain-containing protein, partial [Bacteroidota bacterium]